MEISTFVIAVVGVLLGVLSLVWQAATFFLSGPRVKIIIREGFRGPGGSILGPNLMYTREGLDAIARLGYTEHVLGVEAVNRGRLPMTVNSWTIRFGNGVAYGNQTDPLNPPLPHRLEPWTSAIWFAPVNDLSVLQKSFADESEKAAAARGALDLPGRTKPAQSKNAIVICDGATREVLPGRLARVLARRGHLSRG